MAVIAPPTPPAFPLPTDEPDDFDDKAYDCFPYVEDAANNVYANAQDAAGSATASANSATASANSAAESEVSRQAADSIANYKGLWSGLSGALNKPATVGHNGAFWALNNNLANVALSEPAPGNADWSFVSGTRWVSYTASGALSANMMAAVTATTANVDLTMPTFAAKDFLIVSNDSVSTYQVRILNSNCTIRSVNFTASAGDNITLAPGETMHLRAVSPTILEVVQNG